MFWAVLGLVFVGLTWTIVGVVLGKAPQKGIPSEIMISFSAAVPAIVGALVLNSGIVETVDWTSKAAIVGSLYYTLAAFFNFFMMHLMSHAMQKGPNGIIWSITQSGMVLTFLYGVIFEGDIVTVLRIVGLITILGALLLLGLARDNQGKEKSRTWIWMALGCFLLCGTNQICAMIPTYIQEVRDGFNSVARSTVLSTATMVFALIWNIASKRKAFFADMKQHIHNKYLWIFVGVQQGFCLLAAYFIQYRCIDYLSAHNHGSVAYPTLVASCLVGFALYSTFILREKTSFAQKLGMLLCVAGMILICLK